jgi:hypothetical protein
MDKDIIQTSKFPIAKREQEFQSLLECAYSFWDDTDRLLQIVTKSLERDKEIENHEMAVEHLKDIYNILNTIMKYWTMMFKKMENMTGQQCSKMNYMATLVNEKIKTSLIIYTFTSYCLDL